MSRFWNRRPFRGKQRQQIARKRLDLETLENRLVLDSTVVFNELMFNPVDDTDDTAEWIELYNQLNVDMDVSEWRLDGGVDFDFPDGTTVPGRGFLIIAASPDTLEGVAEGVEVIGPYSGTLSNGGEEIRLENIDGRLMNVIEYGDGGKWPVGPDGGGVTLAKADELTGTDEVANWTASAEIGGTPGAENFITRDVGVPNLQSIFSHSAAKKVFIPTNGALGDTWQQANFDDSSWISGTGGVGFEKSSGYDPYIGIDVETEMEGRAVAYVRVPFTTNVAAADIDSLLLDMRYDDGFVAYLNGTQVASANMPANVDWDVDADGSHDDQQAIAGESFDITAFKNLLIPNGTNVLAIHGANTTVTSTDFLISPTLGYVPSSITPGGGDGQSIVITEVTAATGTVSVELRNVTGESINIEGSVLTATGATGGDYVFTSQSIPADGYLVISETDMGIDLVDNERLFLYSPDKTELLDARPVTNRLRGLNIDEFAGEWLYPSAATLGADNTFSFETDIVINEVMYNAQPQLDDPTTGQLFTKSDEEWIELFNRSSSAIDLSGWELRDAVRFTFADGTMLGAGEYLVVAGNAAALSAKYPSITVAGEFSGSLGNVEDNILLVDGNSNPADSVHYFERGQWPSAPDAGGSTLELKNPLADNSSPNAWAASDEGSKSEWKTFTVQRTSNEPLQFGTNYNEFIFGLLDGGEFLIDDIRVVENPNSTNFQVIQNGTFQSSGIGSSPATWRLIGTHSGTVTTDPDDPSNRVLHVVAAGPQQHVHDHVETTFIGNRTIRNGVTYEISFRAKWLSGSRQLNNRMYFNRSSTTAILDAPTNNGTPGAQNSMYEANVGPTYSGMTHSPIIPSANQPVTVTIQADDPDNVQTMTLRWRRNGGSWTNVTMTHAGGGEYSGTVPGQSSGQVVQFYVTGTDGLGETSQFPVRGEDSRALFQVNNGASTTRPIDTLHVIIRSADNSQLFSSANRMSNNYYGATLVRAGEEVFYDVEVRQIGSRYIRPNSGMKVKLTPEHRYFGVHDSIRLDMNGLDEIIYKQMVNRTGGSEVSLYDDVGYMITPQHGQQTILLGLARYEDVFLKEQFENGGDGTKFELDDITYPTDPSPSPEGLKTGTGVSPQDIRYRGSDLENYRGQLLIRNNRSLDDYEPMVEFARVINLSGTALENAVEDVMDVDLWMRHYATQSFLGNWDTYGFRRPKNIRIYVRPDDGKIMPLYWDSDLANLTEPLIYNGGETRLDEIRNIPKFERLFWGHMWDMTNRAFNREYASVWASHYTSLGANANGRVSAIGNRYTQARSQAQSAIPVVPFNITTNGGNPLSVNDSLTTITGDGWIDVREIRRTDTGQKLDVEWTDDNTWTVRVPIEFGVNTIGLEAFDFEGNSISTDSIVITSTSTVRPLRELLRISEINFNPEGDDTTEFVELMNTATGGTPLDLSGVRFTNGIEFDFTNSSVTTLAAGERVVVVKDLAAFEAMYGGGINVAGTFVGSLNNGGESIMLTDSAGVAVHDFNYSDGWYSLADGGGFTLNTVDATQDIELWDAKAGWRPSELTTGTPGGADNGLAPDSIVVNEVSNNATGSNWIELRNTSDSPANISNWYLSDDASTVAKYRFASGTTIPAGGYLVLNEESTFGSGVFPFVLSELGGELRLRSSNAAGALTGYQHNESYGASDPNMTHGLTGTSDGPEFTVLSGGTQGANNSGPSIGPIVINEIMYNPAIGGGPDFIELRNLTNDSISLDGWGITNGITFSFPSDATIGPSGFAVVIEGTGLDPQQAADFRADYDVPANVPVYIYDQASSGTLDNAGERLTLGEASSFVAASISVDSLRYNDAAPWPLSPDGQGASLSKTVAGAFGADPQNWGAGSADGTPGRENLFLDETPPSNPFDLNGAIVDGGQIALAWAPSSDVETGIETYNIYLDGEIVATSAIQFYVGPIEFESGASANYEVSAVNGDGIESGRSNLVTIGSQSVSFQQGVGGYSGATDAEMREGNPTQNNGLTDTSLEVDGEDGGSELAILMRWEDLNIPADASVVAASITVNITNSGAVYDISQVSRDWSEGEVTWTRAAAGQNWQTGGAKGNADSGPKVGEVSGGTGSNTLDFNAAGVAMVEGWLANSASNFGILIDNPGGATDGVDIDSKETGSSSNRPELTINYLSANQSLVDGDYTLDGVVDHLDIATLCRAIEVGSPDSRFSLDGNDGPASQSDMDELITNVIGTTYGDANLNGVTDASDYIIWRSNRFENGRSWLTGDFNCDGGTDGSDFNIWNDNRFAAAPNAAQQVARAPQAAAADEIAVLPMNAFNLELTPASIRLGGHNSSASAIDGALSHESPQATTIETLAASRSRTRQANSTQMRRVVESGASQDSTKVDSVNETNLVDQLFAAW